MLCRRWLGFSESRGSCKFLTPRWDLRRSKWADRRGRLVEDRYSNLLGCPLGSVLKVVRVGDQSGDFLRHLDHNGINVGSHLEVKARSQAGDNVELAMDDGSQLTLGFRAAAKIFVEESGRR